MSSLALQQPAKVFMITKQPQLVLAVSTKLCELIISISYISCLLTAHSEKSDVYKITQSSIPKSALLCRVTAASRRRLLGNHESICQLKAQNSKLLLQKAQHPKLHSTVV